MFEGDAEDTFQYELVPAPCIDGSADVVLKSREGHDLRAHQVILAAASPIFVGTFSLPQAIPSSDGARAGIALAPTDDTKDGLPTVQMSESKAELDMFLRLCYPTPLPPLESIDTVKMALQLAQKFELEHVNSLVRLPLKHLAEQAPEQVYAVAWKHQLREVALAAARGSLSRPNLQGSSYPEFDTISGTAVHRLLTYQRQCRETAVASVRDLKWVKRAPWDAKGPCPGGCPVTDAPILSDGQPLTNTVRPIKTWFVTYLSAAHAAVLLKPQGSSVKTFDVLRNATVQAGACKECKDRASGALREFATTLAARIDRMVDTVSLETPF